MTIRYYTTDLSKAMEYIRIHLRDKYSVSAYKRGLEYIVQISGLEEAEQTEPNCSEKPNNCDEPQTERYCTNCKHNGVIADYECRECCGMDNHEFIEPQTDCDHKCVQTEIGCERTDCAWK